jgi:hypothetical protein
MRGGRLFAACALASTLLGGCGVKPLKAPCSRDEGPPIVPMAYSSFGPGKPIAADECGPMRPVNAAPVR